MKELLRKVAEISKKHEELNKISGNSFNIFEVINVTTDEVRLHSKFIAELLNPNGAHGQGDIFLQLFTELLNIKLDTASAKVKIEKHIGTKTEITGGYLDIFIWDDNENSITIENKIYAKDQEAQLLRYYNHNPNNLLYLNLWGSKPSKKSYIFNNKEGKALKGKTRLDINKDFKIISYKSEIIQWLTNCRKEAVELPLLREGITHYINLIKTLTGQSGTTKMNTEIRDYIASTSDTLKQASFIEENMIAAKIKIQWLFWQNLKDKLEVKLKEQKLALIDQKNVKWDNVRSYYEDSRNKDRNYGFMIKIYQKDNITLHFGIEVDHKIFFGFTIEEDGKGGISNLEKYSAYKDLVKEINPQYANHEYWLGWRHTEEKLDFRAFNSDAIFNLADRNILDNTTTTIVNNIMADITALKSKLNQQ